MAYRRIGSVLLAAVLTFTPAGVPAAGAVTGPAPGGPGVDQPYLPADKTGFLTSADTRSTVWATVQRAGGLGEVFYPDLGTPSVRALQFVVTGPGGYAVRAEQADVTTELTGTRSLSYRQTLAERSGRWRLTVSWTTDPRSAVVLAALRFTTRGDRPLRLHVVHDPALAGTRGDDSGRTEGRALIAADGDVAAALAAAPAFTATSSGYAGVNDGWTDLLADGRMDHRYAAAAPGSLVQTAETALTGRPGHRDATLALGFAASGEAARGVTRDALHHGFPRISREYAHGWSRYLDGLDRPPPGTDHRLWRVSAMVLAAAEDKTHRGAYVAAPAAPWAFGRDDPSGPYHLVWARDLYQIATGLLAAGDRAGANRALDHLFAVQQRPDGSFPQNARLDGTPVWDGLQLDEVALPIVLAHQLGRTDPRTRAGVRRAADFLIGFERDGNRAPWTPQDRWENQSGYSPATIAAAIAGLVCAADMARTGGDVAAQRRYLAAADAWQSRVRGWTVTTTGPYSARPYFLRLTKDGQPDRGTTYDIGDSGPAGVDQRRVVDPGFLELVRLGVLPAGDPAVRNSLTVVDRQLGVPTRRGLFWYRASFDGYGEKADGSQWDYPLPAGSGITRGRAWPLLNGERGEYLIAAGEPAAAREQLAVMARAAGPGLLLPEQVWDRRPPYAEPGTPTTSATPLTWTHAQYLRLARNIAEGRVTERPAVVAERYLPRAQRSQ
ncbi:glycoside hydrolase family 15 protein [Actinoplanes xinjiangensis]|uniref:Glucoamylase n=1 Tax=Actinoplanes xinjiangensis TaxID=512350 RepID=A0A316F1V3_9ACTN|nr:glycoside hydrolase family 15 protein [Actinoplanes xinjiangensis]PWK29787.1 glucoamylase [Actinoplanes xinjiangensis]GIF44819.1 glucan 1,4-alpha-glucosidase [Actinoplanes xinjiangensis]